MLMLLHWPPTQALFIVYRYMDSCSETNLTCLSSMSGIWIVPRQKYTHAVWDSNTWNKHSYQQWMHISYPFAVSKLSPQSLSLWKLKISAKSGAFDTTVFMQMYGSSKDGLGNVLATIKGAEVFVDYKRSSIPLFWKHPAVQWGLTCIARDF